MAFSVILRNLVNTAPRLVAPAQRLRPALALPSLIRTRNLFHQPNARLPPATGFPIHRYFSASSTDNKLPEVKEGCPEYFPIKIQDISREGVVKVKRGYEGDTITVKVWKDFQCQENSYKLDVRVEKKNGASLPATGFPRHLKFSALSTDKKLLEVIDSEIQCTLRKNEQEEGCPKYFPFTIENDPGENAITLKREYEGETITVKVWNNFRYRGNGDGEEKSSELDVRVDKENGASLEFTCTAFPHKMVICSVFTKNPDASEYEFDYSDFKDLNENLQKSFQEYLEVRGITPRMVEFLQEKYKYHKLRPRINKNLMKNDEDYLRWLNELKTVIEA